MNPSKSNIYNIPESKLSEIIDSGMGSDSERRQYILSWVDKHYADKKQRLGDSISYIVASIGLDGIENNPLVKYIDNFLSKTSYTLTSDYLNTLSTVLSNGKLSPDERSLYSSSLYDEGVQDNVDKLTALVYILSSGGSLKLKDNSRITVSDIIGKKAKDVRKLFNNLDTYDNNNVNSIGKWVTSNGMSPVDLYTYMNKRISEVVPKHKVALYKRYLLQILDDNQLLSQLLSRRIADTSDETIVKSIVQFLDSIHQIVLKKSKKNKQTDYNSELKDDVVSALTTLKLPKKEAERYFNQVYKKGMSAEEAISAILSTYGSSL